MKEFDLELQTPAGEVVSSVEVTSVAKRVSQPSDVTNGVRHAVDKVFDRLGTEEPIEGSPQVLIHITLDVGRTPLRRGLTREISPDGTLQIFRPDGQTIRSNRTSGNLYDDIAANLSRVQDHALLDRVVLVDQTGRRIVYVREGSSGTRE